MRIRLHTNKKRGKHARIRRWIILSGSVCVLVFCVFGLTRYIVNARRSALISQTFQEIYYSEDASRTETQAPGLGGSILRQFEVTFPKAAAETGAAPPSAAPKASGWPGNPAMTVMPALKKLQKQNKDVVGWLSIPDMLEQAVVQRDNSYYLKRDYLGYHNANGALFLEESISLKSRPDAYVIFGHNMKTGDMFGSLRLYEDAGYYRKHALISFSALYEDGQYVVFAVTDVDIIQGMRRYVPFMQLPGMEKTQRAACIQRLQAYSRILSPVQVSADDQLLLLVTCEGTEENRRVVAARRLREGETPDRMQALLQNARKRD